MRNSEQTVFENFRQAKNEEELYAFARTFEVQTAAQLQGQKKIGQSVNKVMQNIIRAVLQAADDLIAAKERRGKRAIEEKKERELRAKKEATKQAAEAKKEEKRAEAPPPPLPPSSSGGAMACIFNVPLENDANVQRISITDRT